MKLEVIKKVERALELSEDVVQELDQVYRKEFERLKKIEKEPRGGGSEGDGESDEDSSSSE